MYKNKDKVVKKDALTPSNHKPTLQKHGLEKTRDIVVNSRTLYIVLPTLEQFSVEREVFRNLVLADLQAYCRDRNIDLETSTFFSSTLDYNQLSFLLSEIEHGGVYVLVFVGDKYGNSVLPLKIRTENFTAIQSAALEVTKDATILKQAYTLDKSKEPNEYILTAPPRGPDSLDKLREIFVKGVPRAREDGTIHLPYRQENMYCRSFIDVVCSALMKSMSSNTIFVCRKFQGFTPVDANDKYIDPAGKNADAIAALKNDISSKVPEANKTFFYCNLNNVDAGTWFNNNNEANKYKVDFAAKISKALKNVLDLSDNMKITASSYSSAPLEVALREHATHERYYQDVTPKAWLPRSQLDKKLENVVEQGLTQSVFVQFYGPPGVGKTATVCRLFELLQQRQCYAIVRFGQLTDCSVFVNELLRNALFIYYEMLRLPHDHSLESYHLVEVLADFKSLMEKIDQPIFLIIDDVHLLKFGHTLGTMKNPLQKLFSKMSLIFTSHRLDQRLECFTAPEMVEMSLLNREQIVEVLKINNMASRKLPPDQINRVRNKLKNGDGDIILAEMLCDEIANGDSELSDSIQKHVLRIESKVGAEPVRIVCQLLCSLPYGLTSLEVSDAYRLVQRNSGMSFDPTDVMTPKPKMVLRYLGCLLINVYTDERKVWAFRHTSVARYIEQKYLTSPGEVKRINENMVNVVSSVSIPDDDHNLVTTNLVFSQPINNENGTVNLRRIRFQWYYALHTGKLDFLKDTTLCYFEYLEACFRGCGLAHLLSIFEECCQEVLDHDILVLFEQVLLPAIPTLIHDTEELVCELLNRLRFTSDKNSFRLNALIEQLMSFADTYNRGPLLLPLNCWISPPKMKQVRSFTMPNWKASKTVIQPTHNHQYLLIGGNDDAVGQIFMYHIASSVLVKTFHGHTDKITEISTSSDGLFFTSASYDGSVRFWNFNNPKDESVRTYNISKSKLMCMILSNDDTFIAVGSTDSTARIISIDSGSVTRSFRYHTGPVVGLQLSSDNTLLITGSGDFVVMIWDIQTGKVIMKMSGLMAPVTCLAITSNDAFLTVACEDETVRVFSMVSSQELHELTGHEGRVNALACSANDCLIFAATRGRILCYDIHNTQLLEMLDCGSNLPVMSLKLTLDNSFVVAACGGTVHLWNVNSVENSATQLEKTKLAFIKLAPDEHSSACGTNDGVVALWDLDLCKCIWSTTPTKHGSVTTITFSPDSIYVFGGFEVGNITVWESANGAMIQTFNLHNTPVISICCFSNGTRALSVDDTATMHIWNLYHNDDINSIEVVATVYNIKGPLFLESHDSALIAHNPKNSKEMIIWSIVENRLTVKTKIYHNEEIVCYCANKNSSIFVTGSMDQSLKIWQIDTGFLIQILVGYDDIVTCCCVSDDGKVVISGGQDKHVYIWDVQTGAVKLSVTTRATILAVQITLDNSVVISADQNGWIEAWNSENRKVLSSFNTHRQIASLVMSSDASRILVRLNDTPQLPVLCLHNTPAYTAIRQGRRTKRFQSTSSCTSSVSDLEVQEAGLTVSTPSPRAKTSTGLKVSISEPVSAVTATKNKKSNICKSVSNGSYDNPASTNSTKSVPGACKRSALCAVL